MSKLPVLGAVNRVFGFFAGILRGVVTVWLGGIFLTVFYYSTWAQPVVKMLLNSGPALWFYENNYLLLLIMRVLK